MSYKIEKTEKKYWVNGYQVRGGWWHSIALSFLSYGVMFTWGKMKDGSGRVAKFKTYFYKLTK